MLTRKIKKTEAQKIMEARHAYARYPAGYVDETGLLLMSQHFGELAERRKRARTKPTKAKGHDR